MSRKSKGKVPKSNEEDINRKHKDVNPNAQYTGESTEWVICLSFFWEIFVV